MSDDAKRFRLRAIDCRNIAKGARHEADRAMLEEIADELDAEARKLEWEERLRKVAGGAGKKGPASGDGPG